MAKKSTELARLIPNAFVVKRPEGEDLIVASNADENKILNYILASQIRSLIEKNLKEYTNLEKILSPKELKDLADAGRSLAEFSATVYEGPAAVSEKKAEAIPVDSTDFSQLTTKKNEDRPSEESPRTDNAGQVAGGG